MGKYISVKIVNKDCKGIYLYADSDAEIITSDKQAKSLINENNFKLQLITKVGTLRGKKVFTFIAGTKNTSTYVQAQKTFLKALEYVASKRTEVRDLLLLHGTVKEPQQQNDDDVDNVSVQKQDTFIDNARNFIDVRSISLRHSTIQNYSTALLVHSKPLHDKLISDITLEDVQSVINELVGKKADATIVLYARTLGAFLNHMKAPLFKEWINLSLPEVNNKVDYTLSLDDTKKIIGAMRNYSGTTVGNQTFYQYAEVRNIFTFLLTGRRISEVLNLKYSDINFETNTFKIPSTRAKGKKELVFNLDDYLLEAIRSQARLKRIDLSVKSNQKKVFSYTKETPRVHFQNLLKALELPRLRLHDIRHMLATTLVQNKVPIQDISVMLGHSSIAITEARYASKSKDQASRATNALNDIIGGV